MDSSEFLLWLAKTVVLVFASARISRLFVHDHWPPAMWLRDRWDRTFSPTGWGILLNCHFCFTVWSTMLVIGWGEISAYDRWWWLGCGWLAASYAAAYVVTYDGDD